MHAGILFLCHVVVRTQMYLFLTFFISLLSPRYLWLFKMAAENVQNEVKQFHEFGLDDRLLKVGNVLYICLERQTIVYLSNYAFFSVIYQAISKLKWLKPTPIQV